VVMAENGEEKKGVGLVGGVAAIGAGVGTAAGASSYMFKRELEKDANKDVKAFRDSFKADGDKKGLADRLAEEFKASNAEPTEAAAKAEWVKKQTEFVTEKLKTQKEALVETVSGSKEAVSKAAAEYAGKTPKPPEASPEVVSKWLDSRVKSNLKSAGLSEDLATKILNGTAAPEEIEVLTNSFSSPTIAKKLEELIDTAGKLNPEDQKAIVELFEKAGIQKDFIRDVSKLGFSDASAEMTKVADKLAEVAKSSNLSEAAKQQVAAVVDGQKAIISEIKTNPVFTKMAEADSAFMKANPHPETIATEALKKWQEGEKAAVEAAKKVEPLAGKIKSADRIVEAAEGVGKGGMIGRATSAFKGLGGGGRTAVVIGAATAVVGTALLARHMRGSKSEEPNFREQITAERAAQSQNTAPAR